MLRVYRIIFLLGIYYGPTISHAQFYTKHTYNGLYSGPYLEHIAFPIGGIGAGMFCLEGTGTISHLSVRNNPDLFNEPVAFAAISLKGKPNCAKVLEGPVPGWKKFGQLGAGRGAEGMTFGLSRFREATFLARFPFATVTLYDRKVPIKVIITGWSPFIPSDSYNSSLPVGALEYNFQNIGSTSQEYIFSYNARNFMTYNQPADQYDNTRTSNHIRSIRNGFILTQDGSIADSSTRGDFAIFVDSSEMPVIDHCWFRGGWWDPLTMTWSRIENFQAKAVEPVASNAPGASLFIPFHLKPGERRTIRVLMAWYVPSTLLRFGFPTSISSDSSVVDSSVNLPSKYHKPWYSSQFKSIEEVATYWHNHYATLKFRSTLFKQAFYSTSLPKVAIEAIAANLSILKSPTVLRQYDGRFWAWEGCNDDKGSCSGTCTHVWNYAQALSHLFPDLERGMRETEFFEDQDKYGHQNYRAALPIRPAGHGYYDAAADGQLGGVMKVYRDWRIFGDSTWLRKLYPKLKISLEYCIRTWDPRHRGTLQEPHHNTYDIEFWGADGMCTSIYLGALQAMIQIGTYLKEDVSLYKELFEKSHAYMEHTLYNGKYFIQNTQWAGLGATNPVDSPILYLRGDFSTEAVKLIATEGPKYQYGNGCLSDGILGTWLARVCGLSMTIENKKITSHLMAVYHHNLKDDLTDYSNPQRPTFALGREGGLLLCTWPKGGRVSLPFVYSNEVWTGIEYEVASHLIFQGKIKEGLHILRLCRDRYCGLIRNPFDEYECGHWYARALSSYALLEAFTGVRYDAVTKDLYIASKVRHFKTFLSTATGFGTVTFSSGKITLRTIYGQIPVRNIILQN